MTIFVNFIAIKLTDITAQPLSTSVLMNLGSFTAKLDSSHLQRRYSQSNVCDYQSWQQLEQIQIPFQLMSQSRLYIDSNYSKLLPEASK